MCKSRSRYIICFKIILYTGTIVGQVKATDADGLYNKVTYSFGDFSDYFAIDSVNGSIRTLRLFEPVANHAEVCLYIDTSVL